MRRPPEVLSLHRAWTCEASPDRHDRETLPSTRMEVIQRGCVTLLQGTCCYKKQEQEFRSFVTDRYGSLNEPPLSVTDPHIAVLSEDTRPLETYMTLIAFGPTAYPSTYDSEQMDLNRRNYLADRSPHVPFCIVEVNESTGDVKAVHIDCCDRVLIDGRVSIDLAMCHHVIHRRVLLPGKPPMYLRMALSSAFDKNVFLCGYADVEQEGDFEPLLLCTLDGMPEAEDEHRHYRSMSSEIDAPEISRGLDERHVATWHGGRDRAKRSTEPLPRPTRKLVYATCCSEEEYGIVLIVIDDDGCVWMRTDDRPACGRRVWFPALPFTRGVEAGDRCQQVLQLYNGFTHRGDEYGFATATRSGGVVVIEGCIGNTREFPDISTRQAALPLQVATLPIGFRPAAVMSFLTASDIIGNACRMEVRPEGSISWIMGHVNCWVHLSGIVFEAHG